MKDREIKAKFWPTEEKTEYRVLLCIGLFKHILTFRCMSNPIEFNICLNAFAVSGLQCSFELNCNMTI